MIGTADTMASTGGWFRRRLGWREAVDIRLSNLEKGQDRIEKTLVELHGRLIDRQVDHAERITRLEST